MGGGATPAALAIAGAVLAGISVVLQVVVIQPGITESWNRIIQKTLSLSNQFTENAIQSALSKLVTDSVSVPDVTDADVDGIWVSDPSSLPPYVDTISRYSAYYSHRINDVGDGPVLELEEFFEALEEFLNEGSDSWGVHDHMNPETCIGTSDLHLRSKRRHALFVA